MHNRNAGNSVEYATQVINLNALIYPFVFANYK